MAIRSIASLSLSFGLVSIPIKLYAATESSAAIRFKLMASGGGSVRQQYVSDAPASAPEATVEAAVEPSRSRPIDVTETKSSVVPFPGTSRVAPGVTKSESESHSDSDSDSDSKRSESEPTVVDRSALVKGYEFERGRYVLFTADELKALEAGSRKTIDIVAFVPQQGVDPIYYDKAYFLAPDKRGAKPYSLLLRAMRETGRCAIGKWAFRSKEYVVQIRPAEGGMVLQQLLYAAEVRSLADLGIDEVLVNDAELTLAKQLIGQISVERYDPSLFVDEEKERILAAVERKVAGQEIVAPADAPVATGAQVLDLVEALRASLRQVPPTRGEAQAPLPATGRERKPVKRAPKKAPDAKPVKVGAKR